MRRFAYVLAAATIAATTTMAVVPAPAQATGTTGAINDPSGVDYDAACAPGTARASSPDSVASPLPPGPAPRWYCDSPLGVSTYHGSTEATDLRTVQLSSNASGQLVASIVIDGSLPPAGSTTAGALDTPSPGQFLGARWRVMFQNTTRQRNVPSNPLGGCTHVSGGAVYDQHGSWKDGYHFFVGYAVDWDGMKWVHRAEIGVYDPSPGGGFRVTTLGQNSLLWTDTDPHMTFGTNWSASVATAGSTTITVSVDGMVDTSSSVCQPGFVRTVYGASGDTIANVKGLSTVVHAPGPKPGAQPCPPSSDDVCQATGPTLPEADVVSDTTAGSSTIGSQGHNVAGIAYTPGEDDTTDTAGNGSTCPYPTYGGTAPQNPTFTPDTACQLDDDASGRGTANAEFWETAFGFTF